MQSMALLNMFHSPSSSKLPVASAELGSNPFATHLGGKTDAKAQAPAKGKFADVLGLVSNMELADSQDVVGKEVTKADMSQVQDAKLKAMQAAMNAAEISQLGQMNATNSALTSVALNGESIGQQQKLAAEIAPGSAGVTVTQGDLKAQMSAQVLLDGMQAPKNLKATNENAQPDGDAVLQWAHALVRGDIKSVTLENGGDGVGPREMAAQQTAQTSAVEKALLSPELKGVEPKGMSTGKPGVTGAQMQSSVQASQEAPKEGAIAVAVQGKVSAQGEQPAFKAATPPTFNGSVVSDQRVTAKESGDKAGQNADGKSQGKSSAQTAQKGSDFLLKNSVDHQVSNADFRSSFGAMAAGYTTHAAVVKGHELGQPGDSRIQPQTLAYVADKVSELKANGGGRLHVQMTPGNLGTIEISVNMRAGQVHVQVTASNPDTLKMLQSSKSELVGKLANISDPVVDFGTKHDVSLKAEHRAEVLKPFSSESFVSTHKADAPIVTENRATSTSDFLKHSFEASGVGESSSSAGLSEQRQGASQFGSDQSQSHSQQQFERSFNATTDQGESREKAFEKWERSFKDRKSA